MSWPRGARHWPPEEIRADVELAAADFRRRRMGEPLARYLEAFDASVSPVRTLLQQLVDALRDQDADRWRALWSSDAGRVAFRYLSAPPISADDLATLAGAALNEAAAASDEKRERVLGVVRAGLDPRRFPWVVEGRPATDVELAAAALATSSLIASQRVQTLRRGDDKAMVEGGGIGVLVGLGWQAAAVRRGAGVQNLLNDAPPRRSFQTQVNLGADNADVLLRLDDGRLLAIECKGSNSEINSRKRLNKEAAQNARAWLQRFGDQVVPAVAVQGVFNARYVVEAQATPMLVFWGHRLEDLRAFVAAAT